MYADQSCVGCRVRTSFPEASADLSAEAAFLDDYLALCLASNTTICPPTSSAFEPYFAKAL